ncbi:AbrB family transcriptional regulator [Pseudochelatococcus sp. B33]
MKPEALSSARARRRILTLVCCYAFAGVAGWVFDRLGVPLPWMIGPIASTALLGLTGLLWVEVPVQTRPFGQMTVATQVGLGFSPAALAMLIELAPLMIGVALATALCAFLSAVLLSRATDRGLAPAILALMPTSPVEAATVAMRLGYDPIPVVIAQTMRVAAVVILVPIGLYIADGWPDRSVSAQAGADIDLVRLVVTAAVAVCGALLCRRLRLPNAFFLGPLFATAAMTSSGIELQSVPYPLLVVAQLILGTWLGSMFRRDLFVSAGRKVVAPAMASLLLIALCAGSAILFAAVTSQHWEALVLGAAPGGVTEMALTAKFLGEDAALITAFQLVRIFVILPNIPWIVGLVHRLEARR